MEATGTNSLRITLKADNAQDQYLLRKYLLENIYIK